MLSSFEAFTMYNKTYFFIIIYKTTVSIADQLHCLKVQVINTLIQE